MRYLIQSCALIYLFANPADITASRPGEDISNEDDVAETEQINNPYGDDSAGEGHGVGQYPLISPETGRNERIEDAANYFEDEDYLGGAQLDQPETLEEEEEKRTQGELEEGEGGDDHYWKSPERTVDGELEQSEKELDSDWENNFESLGKAVDSQMDDDSRSLEEDVDPEEYDELKSLEKAVDSEGDGDETESQPEKVAGARKSSNDGDGERMSSVKRKLSQTIVRAME